MNLIKILLFMFLLLGLAALPGSAAADPPSLGADVTYFYKNPQPARVTEILVAFSNYTETNASSNQAGMIGFLTGAFEKYPNDIDKILPDALSPPAASAAAIALHLAGQDQAAQPLLTLLSSHGDIVPDFSTLPPSLEAMTPDSGADFDALWGASFATGDPRYCEKILAGYVAIANSGDHAKDMLAILPWLQKTPPPGSLQWLMNKYGPQEATQLIIWSSALWSLASNAKQHDFVRIVVDNYTQAHPEDPAAKALLAY